MSTYVIGDIQGCLEAFQRLLTKLNFNATQDELWFTGDLVNRGKDSLGVLRLIKSLGPKHKVVLGNHDLHLLAVALARAPLSPQDTLQPVLAAADRDELMTWLKSQPLLHHDAAQGYVMTHAGLAPQWSLTTAKRLAAEVEAALRGPSAIDFLRHLYGNEPNYWDESLQGFDRLRAITNYLTRMRYCSVDGKLELTVKGQLKDKPPHLLAWFDMPGRENLTEKILFGHWAALGGKVDVPNVYALDTGCVWGNSLTALRLEDLTRISVDCPCN